MFTNVGLNTTTSSRKINAAIFHAEDDNKNSQRGLSRALIQDQILISLAISNKKWATPPLCQYLKW
jgi:hypothetical protein